MAANRRLVVHSDFWPLETVHILRILIHQCWSSNICKHSFKNQVVANLSKNKFWSLIWWNKILVGDTFPLVSYSWIHNGFWNSWPWRLLSSFVFRVGKSAISLLQLHIVHFRENTRTIWIIFQIYFHFINCIWCVVEVSYVIRKKENVLLWLRLSFHHIICFRRHLICLRL